MKKIVLRAPAKLNLILKVLNKRPDGYHTLKTIFERISLSDDLEFSGAPTNRISIVCDHPHVPVGPKNLVYKIAAILKQDYKIKDGVRIRIRKNIPVAAGLAGGSTDAATALLGLNQLWGLNLPQEKLVSYARQVGSDVAFFLYDTSWALGTERGDVIRPLDIASKLWHVVVVPKVKMYSREVFTHLNLQLTKKDDDVNILLRCLQGNDVVEAQNLLANDLETSILTICPKLQIVKDRVAGCGLNGVSFSGSGPAVFALTTSKEQAQDAALILSKRYTQVFVVCTY